MKCPFCGAHDTQVKDSRPSDDGSAIRRRRQCAKCDGRFTTFERVQLRELTVVKRSGEREPFDRDKLTRSIVIALRKRRVNRDAIEQLVSDIVRSLETGGDVEVSTTTIGAAILQGLARLDPVAYVRFASVYMDFQETKDFARFLNLSETMQPETPPKSGDSE